LAETNKAKESPEEEAIGVFAIAIENAAPSASGFG
jgi:hypothetical protein